MRIICLNGWGGKLHEALAAYIRAASPDVLCLQEVVHTPASDKEWLDYRDADHILPQRANFFRDIADALPDHVATFCPAAQGDLWDGEKVLPSQWGLATFVHKRFPIVGQIQAFVHKTFSPDGNGVDDLFIPEALKSLGVKFHMSVFDARSGQLVYETSDPQRPWNGRIANKGEECSTGDYMWMVEMRDGEKLGGTYNGTVSLLR